MSFEHLNYETYAIYDVMKSSGTKRGDFPGSTPTELALFLRDEVDECHDYYEAQLPKSFDWERVNFVALAECFTDDISDTTMLVRDVLYQHNWRPGRIEGKPVCYSVGQWEQSLRAEIRENRWYYVFGEALPRSFRMKQVDWRQLARHFAS